MYFAERDSLEALVASKWLELLAEEPTGIDENFFEAGGDSIAATRLVGALNRALGLRVTLRGFLGQPTIRGLCRTIRSGGVRVDRVVQFHADGPGAPLIVLPGAGGGMSGMSGLHNPHFQRGTYGVRSLGLEGDEKPLRSAEEIAEDLIKELDGRLQTRAVHLAGLCAGGVLAHTLATRMLARGWIPLSLVLLDTNLCIPPLSIDEYERQKLADLARAAGLDEQQSSELSAEELFREVQDAGLDLVEDDSAAFRQRLDVFAANAMAAGHFSPEPMDLPVLLVSCPTRSRDHLEWCREHRPHDDWPEIVGTRLTEMDVETPHSRVLRDERITARIESFLQAADLEA